MIVNSSKRNAKAVHTKVIVIPDLDGMFTLTWNNAHCL